MGYELRMHIVEESRGQQTIADMKGPADRINARHPGEAKFPVRPIHGSEIARIDLSRPDEGLESLVNTTKLDPGGIWADNGDDLITRDRYDDPIRRVLAKDVLEAMKKHQSEKHDYRRYAIAIGMLETCLARGLGDEQTLVCYFFGH